MCDDEGVWTTHWRSNFSSPSSLEKKKSRKVGIHSFHGHILIDLGHLKVLKFNRNPIGNREINDDFRNPCRIACKRHENKQRYHQPGSIQYYSARKRFKTMSTGKVNTLAASNTRCEESPPPCQNNRNNFSTGEICRLRRTFGRLSALALCLHHSHSLICSNIYIQSSRDKFPSGIRHVIVLLPCGLATHNRIVFVL